MYNTLTGSFANRHIGPRPADLKAMLPDIGVSRLDQLIDETIPPDIRLKTPLDLPGPRDEASCLTHLRALARRNKTHKSYIGMGYYDCIVPSVILRTILENPSWYTPYTPYQAEIAQGRLEALLNFQTVIKDLTGMEVANASLLDEGTAAAEAMTMFHRLQNRKKGATKNKFFVDRSCFPQTVEVIKGRAEPLGIELVFGDAQDPVLEEDLLGALIQYPDQFGAISNPSSFMEKARKRGVLVAVATDLLVCTLLQPPGEWGADAVVGNAQRFGVPMGHGGPHAAFFATREKFVREIPGRIIGVSIDAHGQPAYRMALQTREQHIRREKAKSNICTAQALLATIAGMYAVYHSPEGLQAIAEKIHSFTVLLDERLTELGYKQMNPYYVDTLYIEPSGGSAENLRKRAVQAGLNFRYPDASRVGISLDETTTLQDVEKIVEVFAAAAGHDAPAQKRGLPDGAGQNPTSRNLRIAESLRRKTPFLTHPVFHSYRSETEMMRYIKRLERKDIGLDTSMIPLGSCTMKLNAASEMIPITWPEFSRIHPFAPKEDTEGYLELFEELEKNLCKITGFSDVSLQPNSGAQGEFAGLMVIRAFHIDRGQPQRNVVLIPSSAHGTNPASAIMAGMKVVVVQCDERAYIDLGDLRAKAEQHRETLAALMVTYPSTLGIFEEQIREVCQIIHDYGGQVYMDGANLNAQVGLTSPALIGADVCHINLHKTFSIPHGGGGPGMGPIAVAAHLAPYLPGHPCVEWGGPQAIRPISAAPWGSSSVLIISYAYIRLLGAQGVTQATKYAILNANYIKARLVSHYDVLYTGDRGRVAHELIFDLRPLKEKSGITEEDVAKRLMDYGFHAPTVSWPIPGTMMVEPTESESKEEMDRFCEALISIRKEIEEVIDGKADRENNVLKNAPHPATVATSDQWAYPYTREKAVYPLPWVRDRKFWPGVGRIDNSYGDRNLVCSCPAMEAYAD